MKSLDSFARYFRAVSYLVALSGLFALFASGGVGILVFTVFIFVTAAAWLLEDTKWQLSERVSVAIVAFAVIAFGLDWQFGISGTWASGLLAAGGLARLILFLAAIKLLQKKADKDWILIYLISFFEVLLAAGLSISPLYLLSLTLYFFFTTCAIVAFEIRKSARQDNERKEQAEHSGIRKVVPKNVSDALPAPVVKLSVASFVLLAVITLFGLPIFFSLPRGNAAGFGGDGTSTVSVTGFSDSVTLGTIGKLQQSDKIVMRVRIDRNNNQNLGQILWRGVALDKFDNRIWSKTNPLYRRPFIKNENNLVELDFPNRTDRVTIQTFYLEPMSTNVLFALPRPFALAGLNLVSKDAEDALIGMHDGGQRTSYLVYSDTEVPGADTLRTDTVEYTAALERYLQIPDDLDPRIKQLADRYVSESRAVTRYDVAKTIESRLRRDFAYSLDMKAGGEQPVADFLFNVKAGHCEYFASALAMMLRTQGIASRVVNGFQSGDFNTTAGVYIVRQQNAHSWVEVFFPDSNRWIAFDPTPPNEAASPGGSFFAAISGYFEALETFWIQYVVAFDGQEQRSLFRSFRDGANEYLASGSNSLASIQSALISYWEELRGDKGLIAGIKAAGTGLGLLIAGVLLFFCSRLFLRFILRLSVFKWIRNRLFGTEDDGIVAFYKELQDLLAKNGIVRESFQTPREFAAATGIAEVNSITDKYNLVRFGGRPLDKAVRESVESELQSIRAKLTGK